MRKREVFFSAVEDKFAFLEKEYGFVVAEREDYPRYVAVDYTTTYLAVLVTWEIWDRSLTVQMPILTHPWPEWHEGEDPIVTLTDLARLRAPAMLDRLPRHREIPFVPAPGEIRAMVGQIASALSALGSDLLRGDLSIVSVVQAELEKRAKVIEDDAELINSLNAALGPEEPSESNDIPRLPGEGPQDN